MNRYALRLWVMLALVLGAGGFGLLRGWSDTAVVLAMILVASLCWAPALIALEGLGRERRDGGR